jgi:mRNA interferase YafQ
MRRIERTNAFRRDFKREQRGQYRRDVEALITLIVALLAEDKALPAKNHDHALGWAWQDHRECHLNQICS